MSLKSFFCLKRSFCDSFVSFYIPDALHIMMMEIEIEKKNDIGIKNRNKRKQKQNKKSKNRNKKSKNKSNGIDVKCLLRQETEMALVLSTKKEQNKACSILEKKIK